MVLYATKIGAMKKKSGLVELSRASRFSRSLAQLASGSFQLVSSPAYIPYCLTVQYDTVQVNLLSDV